MAPLGHLGQYFLDVSNQRLSIMNHPSIHVTFCVNAVVATKLADSIMMEESEFGRHVEIGTAMKFPNEMVARFFDILRYANVFGPLLLRVKLGFFAGFTEHPQTGFLFGIVGKLQVEKSVLKTVGRRDFGLIGWDFDAVAAHVLAGHHDLLRVHVLDHFRYGMVGMRH